MTADTTDKLQTVLHQNISLHSKSVQETFSQSRFNLSLGTSIILEGDSHHVSDRSIELGLTEINTC